MDKTMKKQKNTRIEPKYIKNTSGKTIQVYLDIDSYESMINRMKKFDTIKKSLK
jgi:hypothetical protein